MTPGNHTVSRIALQIARERGWTVTNAGEALLAIELGHLSYGPGDVMTQFRLGPYRLDFAIPAERIAIEADGWVHTARNVRARDRERDRHLKAWGWTVVRIDIDDDIRAQLHRHVPDRRDIEGYSRTMRQVDAIFEAYLYRLQRRGVTDPKSQLDQMRDMLKAAYDAIGGRGARTLPTRPLLDDGFPECLT